MAEAGTNADLAEWLVVLREIENILGKASIGVRDRSRLKELYARHHRLHGRARQTIEELKLDHYVRLPFTGQPIDVFNEASNHGAPFQKTAVGVAANTVETAVGALEANPSVGSASEAQAPSSAGEMEPDDPRRRVVMVVHGRDLDLKRSLFQFLRAIDLHPLEWSEARAATGKPNPFVLEIVDAAFEMAGTVVVLMSPDDLASLRPSLLKPEDEPFERTPTAQPRPNVLLEAGIAIGRYPTRTVIVQVGAIRPVSDLSGLHVPHLDDSAETRHDFVSRLRTAGALPNTDNVTDWLREGSFVTRRNGGAAAVFGPVNSTGLIDGVSDMDRSLTLVAVRPGSADFLRSALASATRLETVAPSTFRPAIDAVRQRLEESGPPDLDEADSLMRPIEEQLRQVLLAQARDTGDPIKS